MQARYTSPEFYRWVLGEAFQEALGLLIVVSFLIVVFGALITALRHRRFPWAHAASAFGLLMGAEFLWRYGVDRLPGVGFKDVAIALDIAKPVVLALGLAAILSERRLRLRRAPSPAPVPTA